MIDFILFSFLGSLLGFLSGIIPSLHQNIVIPLIFTVLSQDKQIAIVFVVSFAIAQNFGNSISTYYLSSPPEELSISTLPSQRLAKSGLLIEGLKIYLISAILSMPLVCLFILLFHKDISIFISSLKEYTGLILLIFLYTIFFFEKEKMKSLFIFFLSGFLGIVCFNLIEFNKAVLALFSGFFSLSQAIINLLEKENLLEIQKEETKINLKKREIVFGLALILFLGMISGLLPALGPSQMILIFQSFINDRLFIFINSGLTFSNEVFSTASSYTIGNPRSGLSVQIENFFGKLEHEDFILIVASMLLATFFGSLFFLSTYKRFLKLIKNLNFKILNLLIILTVFSIVFIYSGLIGIVILITSTSLSIIAQFLKVKRSFLMGSLIFSTVLIYTNLYHAFLSILKL